MERLCLAVSGLIVGLGGPTFAADLSGEDRKALDLTEQRYSEAYNAKDPAAWAANFTKDAIRVTPDGIAHGRSAVQKQAEEDIKAGAHALVAKTTFAVRSGNVVVAGGEWAATFGNQTAHGYWSNNLVHEGGRLQISLEAFNVTEPASEAASQPK